MIDGGMHGILIFGSNGEFYMVEEDEMERGLKIMVDQAAGRVPVYFGIGAIRTKNASVWQRWQQQTAQLVFPYSSLCF